MRRRFRTETKRRDRTVGIEIMRIRKDHRMHQRELGNLCDVSARTVLRWENGYRLPSREQYVKLVRSFYGIDPADAQRLADAAGATLETLGIVPPAPPVVPAPASPPPPPPKEIIEHAVFVAAEEIEIAPGRLRAPLVRLFQRLGALGVTYEQAMSAIAPPPVRAARPSGPRTG